MRQAGKVLLWKTERTIDAGSRRTVTIQREGHGIRYEEFQGKGTGLLE